MTRHSTRPRSAPDRDVPVEADLRADQRERRDRIIAAAVEQMVSTGYADVSIREVADRAGVALGTLYRYFSSKDHLMACALHSWSASFADRRWSDTGEDAPTRIAAVFGRAAAAFERQPTVYDTFLHIQTSSDPHAAAVFTEFSTRQTAAFAAAVTAAIGGPADDVVSIMSAVLSEGLRSCQLGLCSRADVHRRIEIAADLLAQGHERRSRSAGRLSPGEPTGS